MCTVALTPTNLIMFLMQCSDNECPFIVTLLFFFYCRLFWFVLTCSCCGIMSYQIIDRIIYYYNSPITVNVKVNYNRSLAFPSVTICNQNAFRQVIPRYILYLYYRNTINAWLLLSFFNMKLTGGFLITLSGCYISPRTVVPTAFGELNIIC